MGLGIQIPGDVIGKIKVKKDPTGPHCLKERNKTFVLEDHCFVVTDFNNDGQVMLQHVGKVIDDGGGIRVPKAPKITIATPGNWQ